MAMDSQSSNPRNVNVQWALIFEHDRVKTRTLLKEGHRRKDAGEICMHGSDAGEKYKFCFSLKSLNHYQLFLMVTPIELEYNFSS